MRMVGCQLFQVPQEPQNQRLSRFARGVEHDDVAVEFAIGSFDISGAGAYAVKCAGLVKLSSFAAHQIVIGQKFLENLVHLYGRHAIVSRYSRAFGNRHIIDTQHLLRIVRGNGDTFGKSAWRPDDLGAGGDEQLVGREVVGMFQEFGDDLLQGRYGIVSEYQSVGIGIYASPFDFSVEADPLFFEEMLEKFTRVDRNFVFIM